MKKTVFLLLLTLLPPLFSHAETATLKLRASRNPGSVRIVFEGPGPVITKGAVTRKENDILVMFPGIGISVWAEGETIAHGMTNRETVRISPGAFSGMKVFTLKDPFRLVVDIYTTEAKGDVPPVSIQNMGPAAVWSGKRTVIIDPGHGGYEDGIVKEGMKEKNTVLDIAQKLSTLVNSGSSRAFLTRGSDRYMSLGERVNIAGSRAADVFISLHIGNHRDIVIYTPVVTDVPPDTVKPYVLNRGQAEYEKDTLILLKAMSEVVIPAFGEEMLLVRPLPYTIVSRIEAAALVIELPSYEYASYEEEFNAQIADVIYRGLNIYEETKIR